MEVLAIIPARGGSKKIPRKNIRLLGGRPMLAWSVLAAQASRLVTRIIVSTDDEEIARVARECGAEVPGLRPAELAGDRVTDLPVFQHTLRLLQEKENYRPEVVVQLRPTAPLRRAEHIDRAVELFQQRRPDCVRTITAATQHPYKMWRMEGEQLQPFMPHLTMAEEMFNQPRQTLPPAFIQNGSVDVIDPRCIVEKNSMTGAVVLGLLMEEIDSVNVDQEEDFLLAELLMKQRISL
jgi:N-acylneuraminate cytidylyltransferase